MTDKIRIVGAFGPGAAAKVQEFVQGLEGVQSVSVLHDGVETYQGDTQPQAGQDTAATTATPATPATPEATPAAEPSA